ncbi:S-layer homology domain-containing protein [Paenibacillus lautus]|uniref:S-layer homology domain-containing protein n=1 Tax=Paenibacillus lautus TaxID=1401 RepID=UPI001C7E0126|nr:S-layer homology domain-containing protein [Paenibacillus lautus]
MRKIGVVFLIFTLVFTGLGVSSGMPVSYAASSDVPGGINAQPVLWLKADEGVVENGGLLTDWEDQSHVPVNFELDVPAGQEARTPKYNASGVNFNPSITFDNPAKYKHYNESAKLVGDKQLTFRSGYAVYKSPSSGHSGVLVGSSVNPGGNNGVIILGGWENTFATGSGHQNLYTYVPSIDRTRHQLTGFEIIDNTDHVGRVDGKNSAVNRRGSFGPITFSPVIGASNGGAQDWTGLRADVAEIILYDELTSTDAAKIETYLAVKYGITLNEGNSSYVAANDEIVWEVDGTYKHNIAGIGHDDAQGLKQKQSRSINAGIPQVAIGVGELSETNAANTGSLSDKQYLIWGDNGKDLIFDQQIGETNEYHAQRVWKLQNTGGVGKVQVAIPVSAIPAGKKLIVSNSGIDFTSANAFVLESKDINGVPHYVATVPEGLEDGQFFTYGVLAPVPENATLEEAVAGGNEIIVTFDQEIDPINVTPQGGFVVTIGDEGRTVTIDSILVEGKTVKLTLSEELRSNDSVKLEYTKANGNIKGTNGASVLDFDMEVGNNLIPPPALEITDPSGDTVYEAKPEIKGTADKEAKVTITLTKEDGTVIGPVEVKIAEDGTWTYTPSNDLPDGKYTIAVTAEKHGKVSKESKDITLDTTNLNLQITDPSGDTVYEEKPEIKGTADKEAKVTVTLTKEDGTVIGPVEIKVAEDGTWTYTPSNELSDGKYTIAVTAEKHGKVSKESKDITVDTTNVVDKSFLKQKVEEINGKIDADELTESNYTPASWVNLERELAEANLVLNNPGATQDQVDQALIELQKALDNLVVFNGELEDLNLVGLTNDGGQVITLEPTFDPDQYKNYQGTVTNDVYGISLNPMVQDPNEVRVFVEGVRYSADEWNKLPLKEGKNVITVGVYDKDGNRINDYTITIYRGDEANKLESLVPSVGSLYPAFDPNQDTYTMNVANSVNQLQLTPTAQDPNATIQIRVNNDEWKTVTSGELSDYLSLNVGPNSIEIKVTDQNGKDKTYNVTVSRASGNDNSGGGNTGGSNSGTGNTTTPPTTDNTVKPGNIVTTDNGSNVSFASGTVNGDQATVTIDSNKLSGILADGKAHKLGIRVPGNGNVEVRGLTLEDLKKIADSGSSLDIEDVLAIYPVPAGQLDVNAISKQFDNAPISNIAANIKIKRSADDVAKLAREKATRGGYELLVHPVDLDLSFMHDGKTDRAGLLKGYAPKYIALPEGINPNRITTGVIVNPDGTVFHVPTVVTKIDNRYFALINDLRSSGSYSVIWNPKDFNDVQYHWGRADVNNIAARLSLKGNGDNTFSPKRHVTRSEFAEIIVLGLGLMRQDAPQNIFPDVPASAWYRNAVALADEFGIVRGYDDGNFKGNQEITREQGFAMIARAYRLIQSEDVPNQAQIASALAPYADGTNVAAWAQGDVAQLIDAGIIQGNGPKLLSPKAEMTRAEVTALIARMLKVTNLIDK